MLGLLFICSPHLGFSQGSQISELKGSISVHLEGGSTERPFFLVSSSSLKGDAVFRGQVRQANDSNISFYEVPNLLDPDKMQPPFKPGVLSTIQARAKVEVENQWQFIFHYPYLSRSKLYKQPGCIRRSTHFGFWLSN